MLHTSNILVVTPDLELAESTQNALRRVGFREVTQASGALETFADLGATSAVPDIALIDLSLHGELDGVALAQRLQARFRIPFIYLADSPQDVQGHRVVQSGPHGYLTKRCRDDELLATLTLALESVREQQQQQTVPQFVAPVSHLEAVLVTDIAGRITYLNTLAEDLTEWPLTEAANRPYQEVFVLLDDQGQRRAHDPLVGRGQGQASWRPAILASRTGTPISIEEHSSTLTDSHGSLAGLYVIFQRTPPLAAQHGATGARDSTLATPLNDQISLGRLLAIVDGIAEPLFTMDEAWRVTFMNSHAEDYFGRSAKSLVGQVFWDDFAESVHSKHYSEYYMAATRQQPRDFEFYDEEQGCWMEVHAYPFAEGLLVFLRDITERKQTLEQSIKLEKLEGLGLLARGFAHDFNNLLTVLLGNVSLAALQSPGEEGYGDALEAAKHATIQAQNLVQQLLTFAKGGVPITEQLDLNEVIRSFLEHRSRYPHIQYQAYLGTEPLVADIDEGQFIRLLDNLLENAEQAMPAGGNLEVSIRMHAPDDLSEQSLAHAPKLDPNTQYLVIEVRDSGPGIPETSLEKIFEPYYSTRTDANATGLGLTVCESIARAHKGFLAVESESGSYTIFRLFVPALSQTWQSPEPPPPASQRRPVNDPPRVLVLEDEKSIRILLVISLRRHGYEVVETEEGSQTVEAYKQAMQEGRPFDLVIMDLSIPHGMGGAEAIQQVQYLDPEVTAVVSSGYSDDPVMANYASYGFAAVLPKPYAPTALLELVGNLIQRERVPS